MSYKIGYSFTKLLKELNNGTEYIVESGLNSGDVVIAEGAGLVREGTIIESQTTQE